MDPFVILISSAFAYANVLFAVSLLLKRNDVADVAWWPGFVLLAWVSYFSFPPSWLAGFVASLLVTAWGVRLAFHIGTRNAKKSEDPRYAQWRNSWGRWFPARSYLQVFMLQWILAFMVAAPVFAIHSGDGSIRPLAILGMLIWWFGFVFETVGDFQLSRFVSRPENRGKVMRAGLWAYTRHPNYFGEVTLWWGIWIFALSFSNGAASVIWPLTITFLILKVSGIPMLESRHVDNPDFQDYAKNVNAFFPWFPKGRG